ncbi:MAG: LON peptidase substrate-binding domain-containing protein [Euryarchaeota archaeon]|nr:LON peptidase substrate-binding domain-containing protein [Euryarchaeota archaeon]
MAPLPLFVLPMVLMPGEIQELRVFEPRYRQMLDDCLLDERNFGLVLNDPFNYTNHWDSPQTHGCEAEILHHETKGSNHFLKIVGRRRFTVSEVIEPALPPFDHPMMDPLTNAEGVDPDLQSMLEFIPDDVGHTKLYISAEVEYIDPLEDTSEEQQERLKELANHVMIRIASLLSIEDDSVQEWIQQAPVMEVIDSDRDTAFAVTALLISDLDTKQRILGSEGIDEAINHLNDHLNAFLEEE